MTLRTHWTLLGVVVAVVPVAVGFLAPRLIHALPLSFEGVLVVSVSLLVVGFLLRTARRPGVHAVGSVLLGIGTTWLALVGGVIGLVLMAAGNWGY
jgi:hypothetical protein